MEEIVDVRVSSAREVIVMDRLVEVASTPVVTTGSSA